MKERETALPGSCPSVLICWTWAGMCCWHGRKGLSDSFLVSPEGQLSCLDAVAPQHMIGNDGRTDREIEGGEYFPLLIEPKHILRGVFQD